MKQSTEDEMKYIHRMQVRWVLAKHGTRQPAPSNRVSSRDHAHEAHLMTMAAMVSCLGFQPACTRLGVTVGYGYDAFLRRALHADGQGGGI
jgi:hypothetical protein